ncbi:hypothetical protein FI667_g16395, partial [Globisporangium splendens]
MKPAFALSFVAIAAFCAVSGVSAFGCKPDKVKGWMTSCDSVSGTSQNNCDNRVCHTSLHRLVEQETVECYVSSGLGAASNLAKYKTLDDFCHGEGPDSNTLTPAPTTQPPPATPVPVAPSTPGTPSIPSAAATPAPNTPSTPSPNGSVPTVTPKPQC